MKARMVKLFFVGDDGAGGIMIERSSGLLVRDNIVLQNEVDSITLRFVKQTSRSDVYLMESEGRVIFNYEFDATDYSIDDVLEMSAIDFMISLNRNEGEII